jgi:uncharacterized protein YgiM (DUF1202 family)
MCAQHVVACKVSEVRLFLVTFILLHCFATGAIAEEQYYKVTVDGPYIELYTGPGRGYPVFHVVDRGKEIEVIKRRTDWFLVRTEKGKEGWVKRADMELTVTADGEKTLFAEAGFGDFSRRRWEAGVMAGDFEGADVMTVYAGYAFTPNFSAEVSVSQVFADFSDAYIGSVSLIAQPFPEWRLSPFFSLGGGIIYTDPKVTLVDEDDRTDQIGSVGIGVRWYLTRRFILRAEYKNHVIFQNKDDNQEIDEWKAGLAFFF